MKFNYYGHSAFTLSDDVTTILFDPFITENPWTQSVRQTSTASTSSSLTATATIMAIPKPLQKPMTLRSSARPKSLAKRAKQAARPMPCMSAQCGFPLWQSTPDTGVPRFGHCRRAGMRRHRRIWRQARLFRRRHRPLLGHENPRSLRADRLRHPAYWR